MEAIIIRGKQDVAPALFAEVYIIALPTRAMLNVVYTYTVADSST